MPDSTSIPQPDTAQFRLEFPKMEPLRKADLLEAKQYLEKKLDWGSGFTLKPVDRVEGRWMFGLLLTLIVVFTILRVGYHNKYRQLQAAFLSTRYMKQVVREEMALRHPFSISLLLIFGLATGLLLFHADRIFHFSPLPFHGILLFFIFSGIVIGSILLKAFLTLIVQFLLAEDGGMVENRYNLLLFNQLTGIALLPFAVLVSFGPNWLILPVLGLSGFIIGGTYLFRLVRSFSTSLNYGTPLVYVFLYLCALEILPLIVAIRVLISEIG
jgi:hypothetical protein